MTILNGLKKLYVKLGGTIDSKHSYDDIGRLMEDVADVVNNSPGIPEVTAEDNGKVLSVVDGEWNKADASGSNLVYKLRNIGGGEYELVDGVLKTEIYNKLENGETNILLHQIVSDVSEAWLRPVNKFNGVYIFTNVYVESGGNYFIGICKINNEASSMVKSSAKRLNN